MAQSIPVLATSRDAPDLWAGLTYQKLVTLLAWCELRDDQVLYIETGEDFAVADAETARLVQVKHRRGTVSLSDAGARQVMEAAWERDTGSVTLFWTKASPRRERGLPASSGNGITLWGLAASGDAEAVEGLRSYLSKRGGWAAPMAAALRDERSDTLVPRLFQKVQWLTDRPTLPRQRAQCRNALRELLQGRLDNPAAAVGLIAPVLLERIETVARGPASDRALDRNDLLESIETALSRMRLVNQIEAPVQTSGRAERVVERELDRLHGVLDTEAASVLAEAEQAWRDGRPSEAERISRRCLRLSESDAVRAAAHRLCARIALSRDDVQTARQDAAAAQTLDPDPQRLLELSILATEDLDQALDQLQADGLTLEQQVLRAELLVRADRPDEALKALPADPPADIASKVGRLRVLALAAAGRLGAAEAALTTLRADGDTRALQASFRLPGLCPGSRQRNGDRAYAMARPDTASPGAERRRRPNCASRRGGHLRRRCGEH